jgi:hypothetical protein
MGGEHFPMLPVAVQLLSAMIAYAINERVARRRNPASLGDEGQPGFVAGFRVSCQRRCASKTFG